MERDNRDEDIMMRGTKQEMLGFRFRLLRPEKKRELWNPDFELLFLLRGRGRVSYEDGEVHNLPMGSVFAINRFQICDLDLDEDGLALSLCVSAETIASFHIKLLKCEVKCQSFFYMEDQQEKFDLIRRDMARIFLEMYKNNEEQPIYMKSRVTALLEDLLSYFTSEKKVEQGRSGRERLQQASDYILQHFREEITLEDMADHLYLSRAYISRSFPQYFGVSFREYVTQVRLAHAVQEMHSGATLTEIAYHNGFVNETAMIRAFRKYRGMTPSEYRKQMEYTVKQREKKGKEREEAAGDHDIFQSLLQYAAVTEQEIETTNESAVSVTVAVNGRKPRVAGHWKRVINAGYAASVPQVRLAHAVQEMHSGATLTEIAYHNGFVNETAMIRAFRKYRGMTPSEYRKQMEYTVKQREKKGKEREEAAGDHDIFQSLLQYAAVTEQEIETTNESAVSVTVAVNGRKPRVAGHWKRVINAGYAASVLNREVQDELEQLVQELGYELIRVKGILDDDMCVFRRNMWGEIQFCWNYIDEVIDFILSTGAKPLLEFGHMPLLLAKTDPGRMMRPALSSSPRDLAEWRMLIRNLMEHLRERYGINQMRRWIFNPWISGDAIMSDEGDAFFETWKASYDEMKRVSPDLVTCLSFGLGPEEHLKAFIETMKEKECVPEIFAFRSFGTVLYGEEEEKMNLIQNNESANMIVSRDPDFLRNRGEKVKGLLQKAGLGALPVLVDECSSNIWQRDLCNDTCYKAAWLFKNLLENEEALQGIAYFSVNDRLDEVFPARETYHGGFGLFTMNGIPKAVCTALRLLGRMGSRLVKRGDGYFISTEPEKNQSQIYLYNYVHYDMLYRYRHAVNISRTDRYRVFNMGEIRTFSVKLTGLEPGKYCLRLYKVTKEHGSSYDAWVRMGAPERMNRMERAMLCHSADPEYRVWEQETDPEGSLTVQERLEPHETALIEVEQIL